MPHTTVKGVISGTVVDGKIHADFGNLHIAHDAVSTDVELTVIVLRCCQKCLLAVCFLRCGAGGDCSIVGNSQLTGFQQLRVVGLLNDFLIGSVDFRCVLLVYEIADDRIQRQPQRKQEQDRRQHQSQNFAFHSELPIP